MASAAMVTGLSREEALGEGVVGQGAEREGLNLGLGVDSFIRLMSVSSSFFFLFFVP